jgi:hypothetical protein
VTGGRSPRTTWASDRLVEVCRWRTSRSVSCPEDQNS